MLLTVGGVLVWWVRDLFQLRSLVNDCNTQEKRRIDEGLAPGSMPFLPPRRELKLNAPPQWAERRAGKGRVVGSALLLTLLGFTLGTVTASTGLYEPSIILLLFCIASLLAARWKRMSSIPGLNALSRWVHRLRLYYHTVDPGSLWLLILRPLFGVFIAPWRPKARAEVKLYLQFGGVLVLVFFVGDALELMQSGGLWNGFFLLISEFLQTLLFTYLFVAPAGALLTTQLLLADRDGVVWFLCSLILCAVCLGLYTVL